VSPATRAWLGRTALALLAGFAVAALPGCRDGDVTTLEPGPIAPASGTPEQERNGAIRVDAAGISGRIQGQSVALRIPIEAVRAGSGKLELSLRSVDDATVFSASELGYTLGEGAGAVLEATLAVPEGTATQADLVKLNLAVRSTGGLSVTRSLQHVIPPYEVLVEGPARLAAGKQVSYRVSARDALTHAPLPQQEVVLSLASPTGSAESHTLTTDESGAASLALRVTEPGNYDVSASAQAFGVPAAVAQPVAVEARNARVLLTTDKPIYKPGQTIHLRALSLSSADRRPAANANITFEVEDGKGNKVFKRTLQADAFGVASSEFVIGNIVNEGTYKIRVVSGDTQTEKTVQVFQYVLPKFKIGIETDKAWYLAGETLAAELDARYFFGKPVADAEVVVELGALVTGETVYGRVQSRTSADGTLHVELPLPSALPGLDINAGNAVAFLRVTATDGAGQSVTQERSLTVAADPVRITLVPEAGQLVSGIENQLDLFVSDPLGAPMGGLAADVVLEGESHPLVTDAFGHARVAWVPQPGQVTARVDLGINRAPVSKTFTFSEQQGSEPLLVRTDRAVYAVGDEVQVEVRTSGSGSVFVDWLNEGQAVDMRTLQASDGIARFTMPVDTSLLGENHINAYIVEPDGDIVRSGRSVFARGGSQLQITMQADRAVYAPGQPAQLSFHVTDESGAPAVAALGIQIVDQAVFAVVDAKPGLLSTYFELEDDFAQPRYEIEAPGGDLGSLLLQQTASGDDASRGAAQVRAAANLAALGAAPLSGLQASSWAATVQQSKGLLAPFLDAQKDRLSEALRPVAASAFVELEGQGCRSRDYYCSSLQKPFFQALQELLSERALAYDFWGNAFSAAGQGELAWSDAVRLTSPGPDERPGTGDDVTLVISYADLQLQEALRQRGFDALEDGNFGPPALPQGAPAANAGGGAAGSGSGTADGTDGSTAPRLRQDFPETLYVNPALITDATGQATLSVDMADSITEWRVSALGNTASGQLGGAVSGVTVFQDFFVDVSFPATLTRGDEVDFPIAVYNYLDTPQNVSLALEPAAWYTPLGDTQLSVALGPGEVRGVSLPVRVEQVGLQTLRLTGSGPGASDAVARRVRVVPDGKAFPVALSGALEPGSVEHTVSFPVGAVPGSEQLYLNVYPAFLAQAVSGMDSVLQVPSGCFEQTTSTTWPNVLVTRYMQQAGQITPEIQLRAESLISAGYQRLLTFEHPGGGFSWFGTQDPAPFLSVTAFGLMEFADMKAVHEIDPAMLQRTQDWLVAQQAGDGSWPGDQSEFFSFHTSGVRNTAFVLWALAENGYQGPALARGASYVKQNLAGGAASEQNDPYTLALAANALVASGDAEASSVLAQLESLKTQDGDEVYWTTELQTNFYGGGRDADVSATALATYALLRANAYPATTQGALQYITAAKDPNGNFGSTQATTWSLKTLLLAASRGTDGAVGSLQVTVDGSPFSQVELRADQSDVMTTVDLSALASAGAHQVELSFVGTGRVSYNLVGSHHLPWSALPPEPTGPLAIEVGYDQTSLAVNDTVRATATIQNLTQETTNMVLVTLGVPPGFTVEMTDFDPYLSAGQLSRAEVTGKQLILYVSELGANQTLSFQYSLSATLPVRASDGGAEVALYYEPERKSQAPAVTLTVTE
ncbi:MAG: hypothetical protein RL685_4238, partial [Pseudomonadota bacterium]